jgi:branched-chain amino acid transport system substrate-binding protein
MFRIKTGIAMLAVIALSGMALPGCKKSAPAGVLNGGRSGIRVVDGDTIEVGEVLSMTGNESTFGLSTHNGIALAVQEINAAGGIKGKKLHIDSLDDQGKPEEAAIATTRLITQSHAIAILGEVASSRSLFMAPIAQDAKTPMLSPSSTNPKVTQVGDYIARVCFIDPFQGYVMARFAADDLKVKNVAILRDVKNEYSIGLADYFVETFKKAGGKIALDQSYSNGDIDFKAQLSAIRTTSPDAIFIPGYYTDVGLIAREAREMGLNVPLLGGDGWDSPKLKEIGGHAINNSYFSNHYSAEDKSQRVQDFIAGYKKQFNATPDGVAALGYDALKVLADAMNRARSLDTESIRDAINATQDFPGVTGSITIDHDRNARKPAVVLEVRDGGFHYRTTVAPPQS